MYVDLIVLLVIVIAVVLFFRKFSSFIYIMVAFDIIYRLLHFIANNVPIEDLSAIIRKYVPTDMVSLIAKYIGTGNIFYTIVCWMMFAIYCVFLFYTVRILVKKNL